MDTHSQPGYPGIKVGVHISLSNPAARSNSISIAIPKKLLQPL
jgi:hypothetical protein